ncbi:MAG: lipopolysaccharide assembly protein LapA domain-containing protein [Pseudomonadota bacterium]|nr:lipopolysaccharide assembly protein LapA domain-containing protein [Pseudomonadota bacterium]
MFTVENSVPLALEVWPFGSVYEVWASVWVLGLLALGIMLGLIIGWLGGTGWRHRARRAERRLRKLENQLAKRETDASRANAVLPPAPSSHGPVKQTTLIED